MRFPRSYALETRSCWLRHVSERSEYAPETWNLGFWTRPVQQRKGFMTEAAQAVIAFGF